MTQDIAPLIYGKDLKYTLYISIVNITTETYFKLIT